MAASKFDCYVHERENYYGETRYCVGSYSQESHTYFWPISDKTARATGCSGASSRTLAGFGGDYQYKTRKSALTAARRIYRGSDDE
jgi:hypothetical protein